MDMQLRVDAIMIKVIYIPNEESESKLGRGVEWRGFTVGLIPRRTRMTSDKADKNVPETVLKFGRLLFRFNLP